MQTCRRQTTSRSRPTKVHAEQAVDVHDSDSVDGEAEEGADGSIGTIDVLLGGLADVPGPKNDDVVAQLTEVRLEGGLVQVNGADSCTFMA